ncbi:MAG: hypothetical protein Q9168_002872 [Polycauliona sp. 1 TL-2023]
MPSKKKSYDPFDYDLEPLSLSTSSSPWHKHQILTSCLNGPTPVSIPAHLHELKTQLEKVHRASRGREVVPRKMVRHFMESFGELYGKLMPGVDGEPIPAAILQEKRAAVHPNDDATTRTRRIAAFRAELTHPFNQRHDIDPTLAISIPIEDGGVVAVLRDLTAESILSKIREALHEAHWWFMEPGFVSWVIAVRQLAGGDMEVFPDTKEHRDVLREYPAWEAVFLEGLKRESLRYGVSPFGLGILKIPHHNEGRKTLLIQQLFDWNEPRIHHLKRIDDILSVEARPTNYGTPIAIMNLATPELANEFINKGIQWGERKYKGRKYVREWSLFQCEECWAFGHTAVSCTQGVKCRQCALGHPERFCKSMELQCVNCGGEHTATDKDCMQKANEARNRRELPGCLKMYWPVEKREGKVVDRRDPKFVKLLSATPHQSEGNHVEGGGVSRKGNVLIRDELGKSGQHEAQIDPKSVSTHAAEQGNHDVRTCHAEGEKAEGFETNEIKNKSHKPPTRKTQKRPNPTRRNQPLYLQIDCGILLIFFKTLDWRRQRLFSNKIPAVIIRSKTDRVPCLRWCVDFNLVAWWVRDDGRRLRVVTSTSGIS